MDASAEHHPADPLANADLASLPRPALRALLQAAGERRFRADQLFRWLHVRMARDWAEMTDLGKPLRTRLQGAAPLPTLPVLLDARSKLDGSRKLVLATTAGAPVETVIMTMAEGRITQCLSSQVGCRMGCDFCATGRMPVRADLSAGQIVEQVAIACRLLASEGQARGGVSGGESGPLAARPHNLVFMGMGEPLDNATAVIDALSILTDPSGYGFSPRRITVSTAGLARRLPELVHEHPRVNLAWSLTATDDDTRKQLMPVGRGVSIQRMIDTLLALPDSGSRKLTLEYALLAGVNDGRDNARRLAAIARQLGAHVNAIPFNEWPGAPYRRPTRDVVRRFAAEVEAGRGSISLRESKGQDIGAACGQLAGAAEGSSGAAPAPVSEASPGAPRSE